MLIGSGRKGSMVETSDSETGGFMHNLARRKQSIPTVHEP
jgi:hypothetical protein